MKKALSLLFIALSLTLFSEPLYEKIEDQSGLTISTPTLLQRKTAKLRLANGMEIYLVSDPELQQSAAALAVGAGSWDDPEEYPGMAHFLEHMLFMGTKKYPQEIEFMQYISDNGGKVNAYTASDRTVYMFSVNNDGFDGALNRLSHFFIDPLFKTGAIERELHAVDQEHAKNIENDGWRQYMIYKETGNPNHPNAKFSTGNADTLRGIPQEAMQAWYKENYSADKMHLVVLSNQPIDRLIEQTVSDFSPVINNQRQVARFPGDMTSDKQKGSFIYIKPVKDLKILSLAWEIPQDLAEDQDVHVAEVLGYIIKNGNKNSLFGLLKRLHLADEINVSQDKLSHSNLLYSIDVSLTESGIEKLDQVISLCFETIARLKKTGVPEYIFNEVQKIATLKYEYQSRQDAFEYVQMAAHTLVDEKIETYPKKTLLPTKYEPEVFHKFLNHLTAENCLYFVTADPSKTGIAPASKEKWMSAEYTLKPLEKKQMIAFKGVGINPQIGLPPPNPYIPKNLELVSNDYSDEVVVPSLLFEDAGAKIYFSEDHRYQVPEVTHFIQIKTPVLSADTRSKVLSDLYLKAAHDQLFPVISTAETAGFRTSLKQENFAFKIAINGYSDTADRLVEEIFHGLKRLRPTKEQFELYKQALYSSYDNGAKELPLLQSFETVSNILFNNAPTSSEKLAALDAIHYEDFTSFSNNVFKTTYVDGLFYGNLTKENASSLYGKIKGKLKTSPYLAEDQISRQILILPEGQGPYMVMQTTPMLGNAAVLAIEQGNCTLERRAAQQVLGKYLKDGFFDTLRTKQQTAYIAKAWENEEEGQLLQFFAVQSSTHQPNDLIARFELFLEDFIKQYTSSFPEERFENIRKMCIATLAMPPENQTLMGTRLATLAFHYDGDFHRIGRRIKALKKLSYEETRQEAINTLSRHNTRRIASLIEGTLPKEKDFRYNLTTKQDLHTNGTFVAWK